MSDSPKYFPTSFSLKTRRIICIVDAIQHDGTRECAAAIQDWSKWNAYIDGDEKWHLKLKETCAPHDDPNEVIVRKDWWVIKDSRGCFWTVNPTVFDMKYQQN